MELQIPQPPKELFANRTEGVLGEESPIYMLEKIECLPGRGILVYRVGATYPEKGWPTPEALLMLNQVKRAVLEFLGLLKNPLILLGVLVHNKEDLMVRFNSIFTRAFSQHLLKPEFLCPASHATYQFLHQMLITAGFDKKISERFAFFVAHVMEYDNAYRYRVQDIVSSANKETLEKNPVKELKRLLGLWHERESQYSKGVGLKIKKLSPLLYLLYVPKYKKAFKESLYLLEGMKFDENDWYWVSMRGEYEYGGVPYEERLKGIVRPQSLMATA